MRRLRGRAVFALTTVLMAGGAQHVAAGPAAPKAQPCRAEALSGRFDGREDGLTQTARFVLLRNKAKASCTLSDRPEGAAVFEVKSSDSHRYSRVELQKALVPPAHVLLRGGEEALLVLEYDNCLPPLPGARTYLALRLRGTGPGRDLTVDAPSEPLTVDGGALRDCNLRIGSYTRPRRN